MFNRKEFNSFMIQAQSHIDRADNDPVELRNALIMMMNGMTKLADSCENDLNEQLQALEANSNTGIDR